MPGLYAVVRTGCRTMDSAGSGDLPTLERSNHVAAVIIVLVVAGAGVYWAMRYNAGSLERLHNRAVKLAAQLNGAGDA